jgi:putative ABC transport system ATP-binding protein
MEEEGRPRVTGRIVCENLVKVYRTEELEVVALQGLDLVVESGELVAIVGASGSGKSTLQSILGGLEAPTAGRVTVAGHDLRALDAGGRRTYRLSVVGFVAQRAAANLIPYLTAAENVAVPLLLRGVSPSRQELRVAEVLDLTGLTRVTDLRAEHLSGGEQQRLAIAVALGNSPAVLLADEPTAELDAESAAELFGALRDVAASGVTVVLTTHDPHVAGSVHRTVAIRDGRTSTETVRAVAGHAGQEYAVLDRAGRLQLPAEYVDALGLRGRVRLVLRDDRVEIRAEDGGGR